jgi:hypothetical protein
MKIMREIRLTNWKVDAFNTFCATPGGPTQPFELAL